MSKEKLKEKIFALVNEYFQNESSIFDRNEPKVTLMSPNYGAEEVNEILDSLFRYQITLNQSQSNKVGEFERRWADYIGVKNCIMVNSGSSANLLVLSFLSKNKSLKKNIFYGDEIITPAVTWTTTVSPIWAIGAIPVFVDVTIDNFTIIPDEIEKAITKKTKAIMPVHLLGNPCIMDEIVKIASKHDLYIIEDTCEAHGAEWKGKRVGSFGDFSTFSFFFSHHLTTMEGGAILTNNDSYAETLRIMRSQGVIRNVVDKKNSFDKIYSLDKKYRLLDPSYMFVEIGYNLRPTELNGGFGLRQLEHLDKSIEIRQRNQVNLTTKLKKFEEFFHLPVFTPGNRHVSFGYPILVKDSAPFKKHDLKKCLISQGIEIRPIMTGLITEHPVVLNYEYRISGNLNNSKFINNNGFFIGNHQKIGPDHTEYIYDCIRGFIEHH